jgi:hypothetical protein
MSGTFQFIVASLSSEQLTAFLNNQITLVEQRRTEALQSFRDAVRRRADEEKAELDAFRASPGDLSGADVSDMEKALACRFSDSEIEVAANGIAASYDKALFRLQTAVGFLPVVATFELSQDDLLSYTADELLSDSPQRLHSTVRRLSIPRGLGLSEKAVDVKR